MNFLQSANSKKIIVLLSMVILVTLAAVLAFTVMRTQNQTATITRPRADAACQTPSCCAAMATTGYDGCDFAERAQCSPAECSAAAGKGSRECETGYRCSQSGKACGGDDSKCDGGDDVCEEIEVPGCRCGVSYSCTAGGGSGGGTGGGTTGGTSSCVNECVNSNEHFGNYSACNYCCGNNSCGTLTPHTGGSGSGAPGNPQGCNDSSPEDVWSCYQKSGNCAGAWACHDELDEGCPKACGKKAGESCTKTSECRGNQLCLGGVCVRKGQTHLECVSDACVRAVGKTADEDGCTTDGASCAAPTESHLVCGTNNTCSRVAGAGTSTCLSESSSCGAQQVTHLTCGTNNTCTRVTGTGTSTCTSEGSTCGQVDECWGNLGVDGQCYDVNADGVINILDFSCMNNLWLSDITPSSNPACGGN